MLSLTVVASAACTDFYMHGDYRLSVRTMDLGSDGGWILSSFPRGAARTQALHPPNGTAISWTSQHGSLGFTAPAHGFPANDSIGEAINEAGLSCGALALSPSKMPEPSGEVPNLHLNYVCQYAVDNFATVEEVRAGLSKVNLWGNSCIGPQVYCNSYVHWVFRDATGKSLVVEFPDAEPHFFDDDNDGKETFGILTNEPNFEYHLMNVQHLLWKRTLARQAVPVPGSWYPEDRFLRAYMVKSAIPPPGSKQEAVAYAVAALNTVTVPMGTPPGTDTAANWPAGHNDHTLWGCIRDHAEKAFYWRSALNPSLQRLRLADVDLSEGAAQRSLDVRTGPWFTDAAARLG